MELKSRHVKTKSVLELKWPEATTATSPDFASVLITNRWWAGIAFPLAEEELLSLSQERSALTHLATIWRNPGDQISATLSSSGDNRQAAQRLEGGLRAWSKMKKRRWGKQCWWTAGGGRERERGGEGNMQGCKLLGDFQYFQSFNKSFALCFCSVFCCFNIFYLVCSVWFYCSFNINKQKQIKAPPTIT